MAKLVRKGGGGSGNWGHAGRPGKVGGSAPRNGGGSQATPTQRSTRYGAEMASSYDGDDGGVGHEFYLHRRDILENTYPDSSNIAGSAKNDVVTYLSDETGVDYDTVNRVIRQWALGSNRSVESMFMQYHVANVFHDKFGTELSNWQKQLLRDFGYDPESPDLGEMLDSDQNLITGYDDPGAEMENIIQTMYDRTQRQMDEFGLKELTIHRGFYGSRGRPDSGDVVSMDENAMESWASTTGSAEMFKGYRTGYILRTTVPKERVLATPFSGWGCLNEDENIIIGANVEDDNGDVVEDTGVTL